MVGVWKPSHGSQGGGCPENFWWISSATKVPFCQNEDPPSSRQQKHLLKVTLPSGLVKSHPFYSNRSGHTISAAFSTCSTCPTMTLVSTNKPFPPGHPHLFTTALQQQTHHNGTQPSFCLPRVIHYPLPASSLNKLQGTKKLLVSYCCFHQYWHFETPQHVLNKLIKWQEMPGSDVQVPSDFSKGIENMFLQVGWISIKFPESILGEKETNIMAVLHMSYMCWESAAPHLNQNFKECHLGL